MTRPLSYAEAVDFLDAHTNLGVKPGLFRMEWLSESLGHPEAIAPVIHVTGTNGKTTTARMIARILQSAGLRTGTYTSPHLQKVNERIEIDTEPVSDERFAELISELLPHLELLVSETGEEATYFEIATAAGFAAFADAPVSAQVLEVGMGGRWDASNVARAEVAVFTNVAVDHSEFLGEDPLTIAGEKAGIIKAGSAVVIGEDDPEVVGVIEEHAAQVGAGDIYRLGRDFGITGRSLAHGGQVLDIDGIYGQYGEVFLPLYGRHQARNAAVAVASVDAFLGRSIGGDELRTALAGTRSPGRIEIVSRSPLVVLDGAHNPAGMAALIDAIDESFMFDRLICVTGIFADKDVSSILRLLTPRADFVIATEVEHGRATSADEIARQAGIAGAREVMVRRPVAGAVETALALARDRDLVLVTGSLYVIGEARDALGVG